MHYYKRNLGDYAKKAGRLSMLQHGSYTLLIDACYDREQFPTRDEAIEWTWASSTAEIEAVEFVLRKFFTLEAGVYVQKRIQEELHEYRQKAETNKRIATERETKRKANSTNRSQDVNEAPPNHKPLTNNQEPIQDQTLSPTALATPPENPGEVPPEKPEPLVCPVVQIVEAYHNAMPNNPRCKVLNDARRRSIRLRWLEASRMTNEPFGYSTQADGILAWKRFFEVCADSDFLTGKIAGRNGAPPFVADVDFLFSPSGFAKVLENKYHREAA